MVSGLRLKLVLQGRNDAQRRSRQGDGFSSEIETDIARPLARRPGTVARGMASRLRLKHRCFHCLVPFFSGRQGDGFSSEIETRITAHPTADPSWPPGGWLLVCA